MWERRLIGKSARFPWPLQRDASEPSALANIHFMAEIYKMAADMAYNSARKRRACRLSFMADKFALSDVVLYMGPLQNLFQILR
jgi:hypothetical protein